MAKKGVTPVIAVVLLLLITVGAVASAWGLYQEIIDDQSAVDDLQVQQAAESTEFSFDSVYQNSTTDNVGVRIRNTGSQPVHLYEDVRLHLNNDQVSDYIAPADWENGFDSEEDYNIDDSDCFGEEHDVTLGEGDEIDCDTGVTFPDAGDQYNFRLEYRQVDGHSWDFSCSPSSSDASFC